MNRQGKKVKQEDVGKLHKDATTIIFKMKCFRIPLNLIMQYKLCLKETCFSVAFM